MDLQVPETLVNVIKSIGDDGSSNSHLGEEDLEWLFFGGLFHQFAMFGGRVPVLDLSDESLETYEESGDFDFTDIEELAWPPLPSLKLDEMKPLIRIFSKYAESPRLWSAGVLHEPGEYLCLYVDSRVELSPLQERNVRQALISQINSHDWGHLQLIADETSRMLCDHQVFRYPGDPE
jgi:hypothetical protein